MERPLWRRLAPLAVSLAAFTAAAAALDPALARAGRWPRPLAEPARTEAIGTVRLFLRFYADFFASGGNPEHVGDVPAATGVKHQLFRDLGFLRETDRVLVLDLATFEPRDAVETGPGRAEVLVAEEWNHIEQRPSDRVPIGRHAGMGRGFRYVLRRGPDGRWLVADWFPDDGAVPVPIEEFVW
ncbi:MAG TPA: hypothetical protein VF875_04920 [Anaeromyxobacter sp.]